jgi:hypothetical protein
MLYVDIPTPADLKSLITFRTDICISIYLPTTPLTQDAQKDRIALKNATKQAAEESLGHGADKRRVAELIEELDDLVDDNAFWRFQARTLAVLASPENVRTFRLPNDLKPIVEVADRYYLMPLLRAVTFPNACYILALDQGPTRLIDVSADLPAQEVKVQGMPRNAASSVAKSSLAGRSPSRRIQGSEGQKVRLRQFARAVDRALRGLLSGSELPLVLAATRPLEPIYRSINTYPHLARAYIEGSPSESSDAQLAERVRPILDSIYRDKLADWKTRFDVMDKAGRTTCDIAQAARAATVGAVDSVLVAIDQVVHGTIDPNGKATFADAAGPNTYPVVDEIANRVILSDGKVLAVRTDDIPQGKPLAAILRWPM